ncbi:hypothetical protein ACFX13_043483 [Malus domestica]
MGVQIHNLSLSSLIILIISAASLQLLAESKTFWADIEALKEFKNSLNLDSVSPGSCVNSWDFTLNLCGNLFNDRFTCGFRCDLVNNFSSASQLTELTELTLDQVSYFGSLSSLSWNFPYLQTLNLSNNFFSGSIPDSLSNLTRLSRLGLSGNSFFGAIPDSIGSLSNLEELFLDNNRLDGAIPQSLHGMAQLKRLELQGNQLGGEFPKLGSLQNLYYLDVSNNAISGGVPINFPPSLLQISMRNNSLEGSIPEAEDEEAAKLKLSNGAASSPPTFKTTKLQNQDQEKEPFVGVNIGTNVLNLLSPSDLVLFLQLQQINHVRLYDADLDILKALSKTKIRRLSTPGNSWRGSKKDETCSSNSNQHQVNHNLPEQALFADRGQRQGPVPVARHR